MAVMDNWRSRKTRVCKFCVHYLPKDNKKGRCRRRAPVIEKGFPVVFLTDSCGELKLR